MIRLTVHYTGRVQGVGFRATARHIAGDYDVSGYVENLSDGRVRLVAEGEKAEVEGLLATIQKRMSRNIEAIDRREGGATGEYSHAGFTIHH